MTTCWNISVNNKSPLLVTGIHRSGTSWVGRMLAAGGGLTYVNEPLSVSHRQGVLGMDVKHWYAYILEENEDAYLPAFQKLTGLKYQFARELGDIHSGRDILRMGRDFLSFTYGRLRGNQPLLKDPFASFSMPWFVRRLHCQVAVTVRHPAGFVSSLKRLGWPFQIQDLLAQPLLLRDHLQGDKADLESVQGNDIIGQASLLWKVLYRTVYQNLQEYPEIIAVRHEDLSRDPIAGFGALYQKLGYEFGPKVQDVILNTSSSENPTRLEKNKTHSVKLNSRANLDNWKKILTVDEIGRIRELTKGVSDFFYSDDDWK